MAKNANGSKPTPRSQKRGTKGVSKKTTALTKQTRKSLPRAAKAKGLAAALLETRSANLKSKPSTPALGLERKSSEYLILERTPMKSFDDLGGMQGIKDQLMKDIVRPFANQTKARFLNMDIPRGVLLVGVPGTGKTVLVDSIVTELRKRGENVRYMRETGSCLSKYYGETEKNIRELFRTANDQQQGPSVVFLDEIDGLGRTRSGKDSGENHTTVLTTLLSEIDTLFHGQVLLVAATNNESHVDPALLRSGRFDVKIHVPLPDAAAREDIIALYFRKKQMKVSSKLMKLIVGSSEGTTGSDLELLVKRIHSEAIERVFPGGSWETMDEKTLTKKKRSVLTTRDEDVILLLQQLVADKQRNISQQEGTQ